MKKWLMVSGAVAVISLAAVAMAEYGPGAARGGPGFGPPEGGPRGGRGQAIQRLLQNRELLKELGVTDEQVAAIKTSVYEHQKQAVQLRANVEMAEIEVHRLMRDDAPDREALMKAIDAAGAAQTALRKAQADELLKVREILGPDITAKVQARIAERMQERRSDDGQGRHARGQRRGDDDDRQVGRGRGGDGKGPAWMQDEMPPPAEDGNR